MSRNRPNRVLELTATRQQQFPKVKLESTKLKSELALRGGLGQPVLVRPLACQIFFRSRRSSQFFCFFSKKHSSSCVGRASVGASVRPFGNSYSTKSLRIIAS